MYQKIKSHIIIIKEILSKTHFFHTDYFSSWLHTFYQINPTDKKTYMHDIITL